MPKQMLNLWGIEVVLGSLREFVASHGPGCTCTVCGALARAQCELSGLSLVFSVIQARAETGDLDAESYLQSFEDECNG